MEDEESGPPSDNSAQLEAELRRTKRENLALQVQVLRNKGQSQQQPARHLGHKASFAPKKRTELVDATCDRIKEATAQLFRRYKFLHAKNEQKYCEELMDDLGIPNLLFPEGDTDRKDEEVLFQRAKFSQVYSKCILGEINESRNYTQSQMKDHTADWLADRQDEEDASAQRDNRQRVCIQLPTDEELEKAMTRDWADLDLAAKIGNIDPDSDKGKAIVAKCARDVARMEAVFDLFVDVLLPSIAGCYGASAFPPSIRCFDSVSLSKVTGSDTAVRITAGSEAFARVMYRNCLNKWNKMHEFRVFNKQKGAFPRYSKKTEANPEWAPRYTDASCGQSRFGGWKKEAITDYVKFQKAVIETRKAKEVLAPVEAACVLRLREKHAAKLGAVGAVVELVREEVAEEAEDFDEIDEE